MRLIDADVLLDDIRHDSKKAIDEGDKVGSFWLGYAAGLVIKQPTIQSALDSETIIRTIETGITATNSNDAYSLGMRNGMRWCKSLIDGVEPKFEEMSVDNGKDLPSIQPEPQWIPVSERLPEDLEEVNVTWVNRNPESYYESIKDKPFTATAVYYKGKWYWWSTCAQDLLAEYGERCSVGLLHEAIEVTAWMPLPEPYQKGSTP